MGSVILATHRFGGTAKPSQPKLSVVTARKPVRGSLDDLIEAFSKDRRMTKTREEYRKDLLGSPNRPADAAMTFLEYITTRGVDFFSAERDDVNDWRLYMEERGLSPSTISRRLASLTGLYTYGIEESHRFRRIKHNPAAHIPRPKGEGLTQYIGVTLAQVDRMLQVTAEPAYRLADRNHRRSRLIVSVLVLLGLRRAELWHADVAHMRVEQGLPLLRVQRKGGSPQDLLIPPPLVAALDEYLAGRTDGPLLLSERGTRLDPSAIYRTVHAVGEHAEIPDLHPHTLRHTCATLAYELGAKDEEVQALLGHRDIRTTRRYIHTTVAYEQSPALRLASALSGALSSRS